MKSLTCTSLLVIVFHSFICAQSAPPEVAAVLHGRWTWASYSGGFGGIPSSNATYRYNVYFTQTTDSAFNISIACTAYEDTSMVLSSPLTFSTNTHPDLPYRVEPDITGYPLNAMSWPNIDFKILSHDSIEFTHKDIMDDFSFLFVRNCCNVSAKAGRYDSVSWRNIAYQLDDFKKHQWICGGTGFDHGITLAVFDSSGCNNWVSRYTDVGSDPLSGYAYNTIHKNIHCKTRDLQAFDFPVVDPGNPNVSAVLQQHVIDFLNSVPNGNFVLAYTVNNPRYNLWTQNLVNAFTTLGSTEIVALTDTNNPNTRQWTFFVRKGFPGTIIEQATPAGVDSAELSATFNCPEIIIDTATGVIPKVTASITIKPNPANDFVQINGNNIPEKITLLNTVGQELQHIFSPILPATLQLTGLEKGVYFLRVETSDKILLRKVVKL